MPLAFTSPVIEPASGNHETKNGRDYRQHDMAIIFIFGVSDRGVATVAPDRSGQLNIHMDGGCTVWGHLDLGLVNAIPLLIYGPNVRQPVFDIPEQPSLIFNQIGDPDSHTEALERCLNLCRQLPVAVPVPVINHPAAVRNTTRDRVAEALQGISGVRVPRTVACHPRSPDEIFSGIESAGLELPAILRIAGDHPAGRLALIRGREDLDRLHAFPLDGRKYYLTEFVDYSDVLGIFHRHRIAMVDGKPVPVSAFFSDQWRVNRSCQDFMRHRTDLGEQAALLEELAADRLPLARTALKQISQRLKLDYFRIDCHIDPDGGVLVFEANANMDIGRDKTPENSDRIELIKQQLQTMVQVSSGKK